MVVSLTDCKHCHVDGAKRVGSKVAFRHAFCFEHGSNVCRPCSGAALLGVATGTFMSALNYFLEGHADTRVLIE